MAQHKSYDAVVKLGATTATDDIESPEHVEPGTEAPTLPQIRHAAEQLTGIIQQRPPDFSAKKIRGRRACDMARDGQPVALKASSVRVDRIEIVEWSWPYLKLRIDCGKGTYIRALARDLGMLLNTGGYLTELRRTRIGTFSVENAVKLDELLRDGAEKHLVPVHYF